MIKKQVIPLEVLIEVECGECGMSLQAETANEVITVTPCEKCMKTSFGEGKVAGWEEAKEAPF